MDIKSRIEVISFIKNSFQQSPEKGWQETNAFIKGSSLNDADKNKFLNASNSVLEARKRLRGNMALRKRSPKVLINRIHAFLNKEHGINVSEKIETAVYADIPLRLAVFMDYADLSKFTDGSARAPRKGDFIFLCRETSAEAGVPVETSALHELSHAFSNCLHKALLGNIMVNNNSLASFKDSLQEAGLLYFREMQTEVVACMWDLSTLENLSVDEAEHFIEISTKRFSGFFVDECYKNTTLYEMANRFPNGTDVLQGWFSSCVQRMQYLKDVAIKMAYKTGSDKENIWRKQIILSAIDQNDLREKKNIEKILSLF